MSDEISDVARAAAESAKFGTKAVEATGKMLAFLARVFKEPIDEAAGIVGDRLKFMRWERQERMAREVEAILEERGVKDARAIPLKVAIPLIQNASLEESDELQDIWNNLIANGMDASRPGIEMSYVDIARSLTPFDARVLRLFHVSADRELKGDVSRLPNFCVKKEQIMEKLDISEVEYLRSVNNLFRLQCLAPAVLKGDVKMGSEPLTIYKGTDMIIMTILGYELVVAASK